MMEVLGFPGCFNGATGVKSSMAFATNLFSHSGSPCDCRVSRSSSQVSFGCLQFSCVYFTSDEETLELKIEVGTWDLFTCAGTCWPSRTVPDQSQPCCLLKCSRHEFVRRLWLSH